MTIILNATCENKIVKVEGKQVVNAEILAKGIGASTGLLVANKDKIFYIVKTFEDLEKIIDSIVALSESLQNAINLIPSSSQQPSPAIAQQIQQAISEIKTKTDEIKAIKEELK